MSGPTSPTITDARLDRLLAEVMAERAEDVYAAAVSSRDMTERIAGGPSLPLLRPGARFAVRGSLAMLVLLVLLAAALLAAFAVGSWLELRNPRLGVAELVIEAVNARDLESFRSLLAEDAVLEFPAIDLRAGGEGQLYMTDGYNPGEWMGLLDDNWGGMDAHLGSCQSVAAATLSCAVRTRWRTLQIEIGEEWTFEFDGERVAHLQMLRVDPDPPNRAMPLALADLKAWEAWLLETHPDQAARLLSSGRDVFAHLYFPYDWTNPDEIGASISEYLATRR